MEGAWFQKGLVLWVKSVYIGGYEPQSKCGAADDTRGYFVWKKKKFFWI